MSSFFGLATGLSNFIFLKSTNSISGNASKLIEKVISLWSLIDFSISLINFISGLTAGLKSFSSRTFLELSETFSSITSTIVSLPYNFSTWLIGTFPGLKPAIFTFSLISFNFFCFKSSKSENGISTRNSFFKPFSFFSSKIFITFSF